MRIAKRLEALGLRLPAPPVIPAGARLPFRFVRLVDNRALLSGHGPTNIDGTFAGPFGKVGRDVTRDQAYESAALTALASLGNLERELGSLDRIRAWLRVFGMVNCAPGFEDTPHVINGFSDLILKVFGEERGQHARSAIGVAELPFGIPVEIEAEVLFD
jgi:enamine deaminase RidA (YjgF/YER057c/UK114 family)